MADVAVILAECANGDGSRFGEIVDLYRRKVQIVIRQFGYRGETLEDLQQEVWLKLFRCAAAYRGETLPGWITSIARSVCVDYSRACACRIKTSSLSSERNENTGEYEVEDRLETEQFAEYVVSKLRSVCGDRVDAIAAWMAGEITTSECAAELEVTEATVRWRAMDSARRIREFVKI